ncbi:hypothetical protein [Synechococcus sp. LA31]|uniref:hypothetical protein n=1 Tax=Synechococcus sp. LA31 TaxID=2741953 RepID=UPI001BDCB355|nr:hypothetical protein [Synechococcus sp. LA31]QVV68793.1 hypothetical protein KJJ24_06705 [Synechococcus sp. LA31]
MVRGLPVAIGEVVVPAVQLFGETPVAAGNGLGGVLDIHGLLADALTVITLCAGVNNAAAQRHGLDAAGARDQVAGI